MSAFFIFKMKDVPCRLCAVQLLQRTKLPYVSVQFMKLLEQIKEQNLSGDGLLNMLVQTE